MALIFGLRDRLNREGSKNQVHMNACIDLMVAKQPERPVR